MRLTFFLLLLAVGASLQDGGDPCLYAVCDQKCESKNVTSMCHCDTGYDLSSEHSHCKAIDKEEPVIIYSTGENVHSYNLVSNSSQVMVRNLDHVVGVFADKDNLYWTDVGREASIIKSDRKNFNKSIAIYGINAPEDISVDWITGNIYFTDSAFKRIGACNYNLTLCTVVINEDLDKPRGLTLDPLKGEMFWSDWGENPHISRGGMDGSNKTVFIHHNIIWPNGLAIDYPNDRLYWVDGDKKTFESVRLDGTDRKVILRNFDRHPYSIAVFEMKLYWSDWNDVSIFSCDKFTGKDIKKLVNETSEIYGLAVYHPALQPKAPNPCPNETASNSCSHLCLLGRNQSYTCACPEGMKLVNNGKNCEVESVMPHLMIWTNETLFDYQHIMMGNPTVKSIRYPLMDSLNHVTHYKDGSYLVADHWLKTIYKFNVESEKPGRRGPDSNPVVYYHDDYVGGLGYDYIGNNIYWTDTYRSSIEIYNADSRRQVSFYFDDEPRNVLLVPEMGIMFVAFFASDHFYIDKMSMGLDTPAINIVGKKYLMFGFWEPLTGLGESNNRETTISMSYDKKNRMIAWADELSGRISVISQTGETHAQTTLEKMNLGRIVTVALDGDYVFWVTKGSTTLNWANRNRASLIIERTDLSRYLHDEQLTLSRNGKWSKTMQIIQLLTYQDQDSSSHPPSKDSPCAANNGNCSHLCLINSSNGRICACPKDMFISKDLQTCTNQQVNHECPEDQRKCSKDSIYCVRPNQICNRIRDCPKGEDEQGCNRSKDCYGSDKFVCREGGCIPLQKRCDSFYDCPDMSDEMSCENNTCDSNQFRCRNGACISQYLQCNGAKNCLDYSDEVDCHEKTCAPNSFQCKSGNCIPLEWKCDGSTDCGDKSDEGEICKDAKCRSDMFTCLNGHCVDSTLTCNEMDDCGDNSDEVDCLFATTVSHVSVMECKADEYQCAGTSECIPEYLRCNKDTDCPEGDDEDNCLECSLDEFTCHNRHCVRMTWLCDGADDCGDNSDEINCACKYNQFTCGNLKCVSTDLVCDGGNDCGDNSDEAHCSCISHHEFACDNKKCISTSKLCDHSDDCGDHSDEKYCHGRLLNVSREATGCSEFVCRLGNCLSYDRVCDGIRDCLDGFDEDGECSTACDEKVNPCDQICRKTPTGPVCQCNRGFRLDDNKIKCLDIDECAESRSSCTQLCHNTPGSYKCSCYSGFILRNDGTSCKVDGPQMEIITATKDDLRKLSLTRSEIEILHRNPTVEITGLDVNVDRNIIYWSNEAIGILNMVNMKTKEKKGVNDIGRPGALAVDWATDNVYLYDSDYPHGIKVCNMIENKCARIITLERSSKVVTITTDPQNGLIFWGQTSWSPFTNPKSEIYRADMNGRHLMAIVYKDVGVASGITIDYMRRKVYWADAFLHVIERCNFDGSGREVIFKENVLQPLGVNIFEDSVFWLDNNAAKLHKCNLYGDKRCQTVDIGTANIYSLFVIYQSSRQPTVNNSCHQHKCDYMCVLRNSSSTCICRDGSSPLANGTCSFESQDVSRNVKLLPCASSTDKIETEQPKSSSLVPILIVLFCGLLLVAGYYLYHKKRLEFPKKSDLSIHFQNPSFERATSMSCVGPVLPPGQHEYSNPINDTSVKIHKSDDKRRIIEVMNSDLSEEENDEFQRINGKRRSLL